MESLFLLALVIVIALVAFVVIYSRAKRQAQNAAREAEHRATGERLHRQAVQEPVLAAEKADQQRLEPDPPKLEEELPKLEEERHKAEGERKSLKEETYRKGEGTQQTAGEEELPEEKAETKPVEPAKRGGRPRTPAQEQKKQPTQETKSRRPKPEIICWKRERRWIAAVELPEELFGTPDLTALQNTSPLTKDEFKEGCWQLRQATGYVVVRWNEDGVTRENEIKLGEENYLLFKLSGQDQNQGRHVKFPSTGSYLVMIPDNWARDEALSGAPSVAPETASFAGYQAHFYILDKDNDGKIAFRTVENEIITIESKASHFKLDGKLLDDANENMGPLYGMIPPKICAVSDEAWMDVETLVVGEEGGGRDRWRTIFTPVRGLIEQDLPTEVAARKAGWYFLRFYDANDDLVESLDFRFAQGLKDIHVNQPPPLPLETGHATVSVEITHEPGWDIRPEDGISGSVRVEQKEDRRIFAIPPDPASDNTCWLAGPHNGPQVGFRVLVERLWWAVGEEGEVPREWKDRHFSLLRGDFAATSNKALWMRLPRPRWIDAVDVGFEQIKSRRFTLKVDEGTITIPCREFADTHEVADRTEDHHLKVWIKRDDIVLESVVAIIRADSTITREKETPTTKAQKDSSEKKSLLKPAILSIPRLASVLTKLRRTTRWPLHVLIKEVRRDYHRGCAARQAGSVEFVKKALCMLAMYLELCDEERIPNFRVKKYWIDQASLAKDKYPEIMDRLKDRYKALNSGRAHRDSGMRQQRQTK